MNNLRTFLTKNTTKNKVLLFSCTNHTPYVKGKRHYKHVIISENFGIKDMNVILSSVFVLYREKFYKI